MCRTVNLPCYFYLPFAIMAVSGTVHTKDRFSQASTTEEISTYKYAPEYIGGRALANRIWWDEARPGVKAFDPDNKLIFMTGPLTGTGACSSGRYEVVSKSPLTGIIGEEA